MSEQPSAAKFTSTEAGQRLLETAGDAEYQWLLERILAIEDEARAAALRERDARPPSVDATPYPAGPGQYPSPDTEHGQELSARLRTFGLDFDRSIWNAEQESRRAALRERA